MAVDEALVRQVVPAGHAERGADAQRPRAAQVLRLRRARLDERRHGQHVGPIGLEKRVDVRVGRDRAKQLAEAAQTSAPRPAAELHGPRVARSTSAAGTSRAARSRSFGASRYSGREVAQVVDRQAQLARDMTPGIVAHGNHVAGEARVAARRSRWSRRRGSSSQCVPPTWNPSCTVWPRSHSRRSVDSKLRTYPSAASRTGSSSVRPEGHRLIRINCSVRRSHVWNRSVRSMYSDTAFGTPGHLRDA